jgi:hypothetical protein
MIAFISKEKVIAAVCCNEWAKIPLNVRSVKNA